MIQHIIRFTVTDVSEDGESIKLSNGAHWQIHLMDILKTVTWRPGQRIALGLSNNLLFPYQLANLDTSGPEVVSAILE